MLNFQVQHPKLILLFGPFDQLYLICVSFEFQIERWLNIKKKQSAEIRWNQQCQSVQLWHPKVVQWRELVELGLCCVDEDKRAYGTKPNSIHQFPGIYQHEACYPSIIRMKLIQWYQFSINIGGSFSNLHQLFCNVLNCPLYRHPQRFNILFFGGVSFCIAKIIAFRICHNTPAPLPPTLTKL